MFCEFCKKPDYDHLCDGCKAVLENVKYLKENYKSVFKRNSDCYSDIDYEYCIKALTLQKFKEIVERL
jgi:hypothetical protein